jgi:polyribonucleotide nucleotidyltransferase
MVFSTQIEVGGRVLEIETGRLAGLANGAVTVRYGDTVILVTATASKSPRAGIDFLPLTVDVAERMYAGGKLPGGFFKREGRPSTDGILMSRLIDRPLRPLFPKHFHSEVQIIGTILSVDKVNAPDILGIIGASAALAISDIPFDDPVSACTIGFIDGELVVNPTYEEMESSLLDLTVAGTSDAVMMVEAGAKFVQESVLVDALQLAQEVNGEIVSLIRDIQAKHGKAKWPAPQQSDAARAAAQAARDHIGGRLKEAMTASGSKTTRQDAVEAVKSSMTAALSGQHDSAHLQSAFHELETEAVREAILNDGRRPDGRRLDEIRPLSSEVGYLPRVHGSAIFSRGETQVLNIVTLASLGDHQKIDTLSPETGKYYLHHYNFPPFSTGEVGRFGFTGRREIGHGALAERALLPVMPSQEEFPYTVRAVSEVVSSNGSTSMASVCASTLALMDAGIPIKAPVAGIAMGLITGPGGQAAVLTDIQGAEDHSGDMDFKVAGTAEGVTALQMDIKVKGITYKVMEKALAQAKAARLEILEHLRSTISAPRPDLSPHAPRMLTIKIPTEKIGAIIGPGGSVIRKMIEEFGVSIDVSDDGTVVIGSPDKEAAEGARAQIQSMTREAAIGAVYQGKVVRIMPFGAFVQILPGKDGLVHISELSDQRVPTVESVVQIGDPLEVVVTNVDHLGRVDLSARAAAELRKRNAEPGANASGQLDLNEFRPKRGERPGGDGDRGGRGRFGGGDGGRRPPWRDRGGDRDFDRPPREPMQRSEPESRPPRDSAPAARPQFEDDDQASGSQPAEQQGEGGTRPGGRRQVGGFRGGRPSPPPPRR